MLWKALGGRDARAFRSAKLRPIGRCKSELNQQTDKPTHQRLVYTCRKGVSRISASATTAPGEKRDRHSTLRGGLIRLIVSYFRPLGTRSKCAVGSDGNYVVMPELVAPLIPQWTQNSAPRRMSGAREVACPTVF